MENTRSDFRHLSPYEYLKQLQYEYVCSNLRNRLYNREVDKNYWAKIAETKKKKISEIAERNSLPTIFDDEDMLKYYNELVYLGKPFPSFYYRNEETKKRLIEWDHYHYYKINEYFRINLNGEILVGQLIKYHVFDSIAKFKIENTEEQIDINLSKVIRIL